MTNANGILCITHQDIAIGESIYTTNEYFTERLITKVDVRFYFGGNCTHVNSKDLYRVEIIINKSGPQYGCRSVQSAFYADRNINFNRQGLKLTDL